MPVRFCYSVSIMTPTTLLLIAFIVFLLVVVFAAPRSKVASIAALAVCVPIAAFSVFGFLASSEPGIDGTPWKIGYAILFLGAGLGFVRSLRTLFRKAPQG